VKCCCHSKAENGKDASTYREGCISAGKHWKVYNPKLITTL
jgi:hypothetical protein